MPRIHLIDGNTKLGPDILTLSLLPITTCDPDATCSHIYGDRKWPLCYAHKFTMRETVRQAWAENTEFALADPAAFFRQLYARIYLGAPPARFRWFVGGDCPNPDFCSRIVWLACVCPRTRFLVFTKRYVWWNALYARGIPADWLPYGEHTRHSGLRSWPANLSVVFSAWPGFPLRSEDRFPIAWTHLSHGPDPRMPTDARECSGSCENCQLCWDAQPGQHVYFHQH